MQCKLCQLGCWRKKGLYNDLRCIPQLFNPIESNNQPQRNIKPDCQNKKGCLDHDQGISNTTIEMSTLRSWNKIKPGLLAALAADTYYTSCE